MGHSIHDNNTSKVFIRLTSLNEVQCVECPRSGPSDRDLRYDTTENFRRGEWVKGRVEGSRRRQSHFDPHVRCIFLET